MLNPVNYASLKNLLFKYYKNKRVLIETRGIIQTKIFIESARVSINRCKIMIYNDITDFSIDFGELKKLKLADKYHIELIYECFSVSIEI